VSTQATKASVSPNSVVVIKSSDEPIVGDRKTVFKRLQDDLVEQISLATANFKHFTNMGDVNNASKFNQIARESIQDLESLKNANSIGQSVPLYHYEKRSYQTIDCNSDLTDNDLEINIIRAVNLPLPKDFEAKDLTTYVKFEFPYPPVFLIFFYSSKKAYRGVSLYFFRKKKKLFLFFQGCDFFSF
jgi:hypothetical protein